MRIGIGGGQDRKLLSAVAAETGGLYQALWCPDSGGRSIRDRSVTRSRAHRADHDARRHRFSFDRHSASVVRRCVEVSEAASPRTPMTCMHASDPAPDPASLYVWRGSRSSPGSSGRRVMDASSRDTGASRSEWYGVRERRSAAPSMAPSVSGTITEEPK